MVYYLKKEDRVKKLIILLLTIISLKATSPKERVEELVKMGKYKEALALSEELCIKDKDKEACEVVVKVYKKGYKKFNIDKNISKAFYFATKACEVGVGKACKLVADLYWDGNREANIKQSLLKAAQYYKKGCKAGNRASCTIGESKGLIVAAITLCYIKNPLKEVKELIEAGYDVNAKLDGLTPLCAAVLKDDFKITKLLLEHGADPSIECKVEKETFTPLQKAIQKKNPLIIELLKNYELKK